MYLVYKAMFLKGDVGLKKIHFSLRFLIALSIAILYSFDRCFTCIALLLIYATGLSGLGKDWVLSVLILTSIPSLWFSITSFVLSILGFTRTIDLPSLLWIFLRSFTLGSAITLFFNMLNVVEIYNFFIRVKMNRFATIPLLIWRVIPYGLMNTYESLAISKIKGEKIRNRIAPAIASILEIGDLIYESSYYKLVCKPKKKIQ